MSKTKGNVIDPLEAIEEFGADAVRFTLASAASSGPTVSVERGRMAGSRNFATKLWNAARFTLGAARGRERPGETSVRPRAVASGPLDPVAARRDGRGGVNAHLEAFRFDEAAGAIYGFLWHELCDGYLEMVKPVLRTETTRRPRRRRAAFCAAASRARWRCCIPFMPFLTEEIWEKLTGRPGTLIVAPYPEGDGSVDDAEAESRRRGAARDRHARAQLPDRSGALRRPSPSRSRSIRESPGKAVIPALEPLAPLLAHLGRLSALRICAAPPPGAFQDVVAGLSLGLGLPQGAARRRTRASRRSSRRWTRRSPRSRRSCGNPSFVEKAPAAGRREERGSACVELEEKRAALGRRGLVISFAEGWLDPRPVAGPRELRLPRTRSRPPTTSAAS